MVNLAHKIEAPKEIFEQLQQPFEWVSLPIQEIFESDLRLEAGVYATDAEKARVQVLNNRFGTIPLSALMQTNHCPRFKRVFVDKSDLPIYQPSQIKELDPLPAAYISDRTNTNINELRVKQGQILMTCSGTVGKVTLVSKTLDEYVFSHDLLRINVIKEIDTGYLYTYFLSNIGRLIIQANNYGAVIKHIEPEHLLRLPIPNAPISLRKEIHSLITKSFDLRDKSNELIDKAQHMLKEALHLPEIDEFSVKEDSNKPYCFSVNAASLDGRLEANYHHPVAQAIIQHIYKYAEKVVVLDDKKIINSILIPGRYKRYYVQPEYGVPFIGGKEILDLDPRGEKFLSLKLHSERIANELVLSQNMILITRSGTIGKINIVPEHWNGWTASEDIIRVITGNEHYPGYLYAWLSSDWGRLLIKRFTYGAVIFHIEQYHISQAPVPILDKSIMLEINDLVLYANELRTQAFRAEQEALKIFNDKVL